MVGLHSAGLGRRDVKRPVIVAGIQTVAAKAGDLGAFDLIVVDECHLIPEAGEGWCLTFLRDAKKELILAGQGHSVLCFMTASMALSLFSA